MNAPNPETSKTTEYQYVSTAQVALALGVSVTTVKRWVDSGILPAHITAGKHRKLLLADVLRLVREGNLPQADLSSLIPKIALSEPNNISKLYSEIISAVEKCDTERIRNILHAGYESGISIEQLADRIIGPALMYVGHEWSVGRLDVMREHRITQSIVSALYELKSFMRLNAEKDRPICLGGAPENDHYILPSLLVKMSLLDCGWDAYNLGPHTPFSAFKSAIHELKPKLVWISVTHITDIDRFLQQYRDFYKEAEEKGVAVAVGGRGLTDNIRVQMPYTTYGDGMQHIASFARSLYKRPSRPKRGRPPGSKSRVRLNFEESEPIQPTEDTKE